MTTTNKRVHWGVRLGRFVVYHAGRPVLELAPLELEAAALEWLAAAVAGGAIALGRDGESLADREALLRGVSAMLAARAELTRPAGYASGSASISGVSR
ncbi:hypothetical protein [Roseivivax marinus]|uniref:hypothetical protein n=1 Tax=Roseivivax marinus TaxID=1379903 RepID=UPI00103873B9|nr:hypothetical protein [Roseivivax marinus]